VVQRSANVSVIRASSVASRTTVGSVAIISRAKELSTEVTLAEPVANMEETRRNPPAPPEPEALVKDDDLGRSKVSGPVGREPSASEMDEPVPFSSDSPQRTASASVVLQRASQGRERRRRTPR
jgi:hypothetical protein